MGLFFAWAIGEGIITARWVKAKAPPPPGALLLPTGLFLGLAILATYQPARTVATVFAFAVDLAIGVRLMESGNPSVKTGWPPPKMLPTQIWPGGNPAPATAAAGSSTPAAKAGQGASRSAEIIKTISELPGLGFIK